MQTEAAEGQEQKNGMSEKNWMLPEASLGVWLEGQEKKKEGARIRLFLKREIQS